MPYEKVTEFEYTVAPQRELAPRIQPLSDDQAPKPVPAAVGVDGRELAHMPTGIYVGRAGYCMAKDDTCGARRAKGTEFCYGHLRGQGRPE